MVGNKRQYWSCRVCRSANVTPWKRNVRQQALDHYGRSCACCGEVEESFLTFDHINGDGNTHRKELGGTGAHLLVVWLKRNGWPDGFQVLCSNCNLGKHLRGVCPHQLEEGAT